MLQPSQVVPITLQARPPIHESGDHHVSEVFPNHDTTYASKATPSIKVVSFQEHPKILPNVDTSLSFFKGWRNLFHKGSTSILSRVSHLRLPRQVDETKPGQNGIPLAEQSTIMKTVIAELLNEQQQVLDTEPHKYDALRAEQTNRLTEVLKELHISSDYYVPDLRASYTPKKRSIRTVSELENALLLAQTKKMFGTFKGKSINGYTNFMQHCINTLNLLAHNKDEFPVIDKIAAKLVNYIIPSDSKIANARNIAVTKKSTVDGFSVSYNFTLTEILNDIKDILARQGLQSYENFYAVPPMNDALDVSAHETKFSEYIRKKFSVTNPNAFFRTSKDLKRDQLMLFTKGLHPLLRLNNITPNLYELEYDDFVASYIETQIRMQPAIDVIRRPHLSRGMKPNANKIQSSDRRSSRHPNNSHSKNNHNRQHTHNGDNSYNNYSNYNNNNKNNYNNPANKSNGHTSRQLTKNNDVRRPNTTYTTNKAPTGGTTNRRGDHKTYPKSKSTTRYPQQGKINNVQASQDDRIDAQSAGKLDGIVYDLSNLVKELKLNTLTICMLILAFLIPFGASAPIGKCKLAPSQYGAYYNQRDFGVENMVKVHYKQLLSNCKIGSIVENKGLRVKDVFLDNHFDFDKKITTIANPNCHNVKTVRFDNNNNDFVEISDDTVDSSSILKKVHAAISAYEQSCELSNMVAPIKEAPPKVIQNAATEKGKTPASSNTNKAPEATTTFRTEYIKKTEHLSTIESMEFDIKALRVELASLKDVREQSRELQIQLHDALQLASSNIE
uniref:Reverse transcriptase domain-containing protein n=1 Tax=Strongyloides papillosus TaxID=174720 RepID=A0A0N5BMS0_STREA